MTRSVSDSSRWSWRDELQQSLVRQARRLPYEVPAFYIADKTVGRAFRGNEEYSGPRKTWYDPSRIIDFGKDLAKTTAIQLGGFMLPVSVAGASKNSSLNFLRTAEQRWNSSYAGYSQLTPVQKKLYQQTNFLRGSLSEIGQDIFSVLDKGIKFSERSSGALSTAIMQFSSVHRNPIGDLYAARHGVTRGSPAPSFKTTARNIARDIYRGDKQALNSSLTGSSQIDSLLDLIPGYKAIRQGLTQGYKEYKNLKSAQVFLDAKENALAKAQNIIIKAHSMPTGVVDEEVNPILKRSIDTILRKRSSPLVKLAKQFEEQIGVRLRGRGSIPYGSAEPTLTDKFEKEIFDGIYKKRLASKLSEIDGVDKQAAENFADQLFFDTLPFSKIRGDKGQLTIIEIKPENRIILGKRRPESDFFQTLIDRYNEGKIGSANPLNISKENLKKTIDEVDSFFIKRVDSGLSIHGNIKVEKTADKIAEEFEKNAVAGVLRQKKLQESDVNTVLAKLKLNTITETDSEFLNIKDRLVRAVAETMGIPTSNATMDLTQAIQKMGIDPSDLRQMKGYLLRNKKMTASQFGSLSQFFGGQGLSLDDFFKNQQDLFKKLHDSNLVGKAVNPSQNQFGPVYTGNIVFQGNDEVFTNPITQIIRLASATAAKGGETSTVKGFYKFGELSNNPIIANFNPIFSGARKVIEFLSNEVRIPIIGINPLQMLGFKDFQTMSQAGQFRVVSAVGGHPFVPKVGGDEFSPDLYIWRSTGGLFGTKGKITAVKAAQVNKERTIKGSRIY
jgi:hypothetical protein